MRPHMAAGIAAVVLDVALLAEVNDQASRLITNGTESVRHRFGQNTVQEVFLSKFLIPRR